MYVYTNKMDIDVWPVRTTWGALGNTVLRDVGNVTHKNPYHHFDINGLPWKSVSFHKIRLVQQHLLHGEKVIWIDIDCLLFVDLRKAYKEVSNFVVYGEGWHKMGSDRVTQVHIPLRNRVYGDIWMADLPMVTEVYRLLDIPVRPLPYMDCQDFWSLFVTLGNFSISGLQDLYPGHCWGFRYTPDMGKTLQVDVDKTGSDLICSNDSLPVGNMAFNHGTFLNYETRLSPRVSDWLKIRLHPPCSQNFESIAPRWERRVWTT
jgi:hypothetical protein